MDNIAKKDRMTATDNERRQTSMEAKLHQRLVKNGENTEEGGRQKSGETKPIEFNQTNNQY